MAVVANPSAPTGWGIDQTTGRFARLLQPEAQPKVASPQIASTAPSFNIALPKQQKPYGGVVQSGPQSQQIAQNPSLPAGYGVDPRTGRIAKVGSIPNVTVAGATTGLDTLGNPQNSIETAKSSFPEFSFDEAFARKGVEQEYGPFYSERIKDYLDKYTSGRNRATEDVSRAIAELEQDQSTRQQEESQQEKLDLEDIDQNFANRGLFYSGARDKARNRMQELRSQRTSSIGRELERRKSSLMRNRDRALSDADILKSQFERDTNRDAEQAYLAAVQQRRAEALRQYLLNLNNAYGADVTQALAGLAF